jgi:hypothetical protein
VRKLPALLDDLEAACGPAPAVPSADGWELVLAENIAYLVDDHTRRTVLAELKETVGLAPEQILAAPSDVLKGIVAGVRPAERVERLRRCAELADDCPSAGSPPPLY